MPITQRRFVSNAALSVLQVIVSGVILFLLYRYLLRRLGAEQLGLWSVLLASTSVARLTDLGMTGSVVKFVARYRARQAPEEASLVVQTTVLTIGGIMGLVLLAVYPLLLRILDWTIPASSILQAKAILPWAVLGVWVGSISGVFQAALDGCQQAGYRNLLNIGGNVFMITAVMWFVPLYGLGGLARVQVAQSVLLVLANWFLLQRFMPGLPWLPWRWSNARFREMFSYSLNFQVTTVAIMLCDPATKILMSRFGGLGAAAYYEMANQLVVRIRTLLVSANSVMVPVIAELQETSPGQLRAMYVRAYETVFFLATPVYAGLLLLLPLVSLVWIGHIEEQFLVFSVILVGTYFLNNLEVPAYFDNLGTGSLRWNTWAHVVMALLNVALGSLLGYAWGALGVAIAASVALLVSSAMVLFAVHRKYQLPARQLIPAAHRPITLVVCGLTVVGILWLTWAEDHGLSNLLSTAVLVLVFLIVYIVAGWRHPYRSQLTRAWQGRTSKASS